MNIKQLAEERMIRGKRSHLDQVWEDLPLSYMVTEAEEEAADIWNYSESFNPILRALVRGLLKGIWFIIKLQRLWL